MAVRVLSFTSALKMSEIIVFLQIIFLSKKPSRKRNHWNSTSFSSYCTSPSSHPTQPAKPMSCTQNFHPASLPHPKPQSQIDTYPISQLPNHPDNYSPSQPFNQTTRNWPAHLLNRPAINPDQVQAGHSPTHPVTERTRRLWRENCIIKTSQLRVIWCISLTSPTSTVPAGIWTSWNAVQVTWQRGEHSLDSEIINLMSDDKFIDTT